MRTESVILTEQEVNAICELINIAVKVEGLKISRYAIILHDKLVQPFLVKKQDNAENKGPQAKAEDIPAA